MENIAAEIFRKLKVDVEPGMLAREYNSGQSTQIPMLPVVSTARRRITRRIQVENRVVIYERARHARGGGPDRDEKENVND
ncbi:hypothetical protein BN2476_230019 [Paraburkholderia piptadeniae]|uniref:Uncharacterized protein n=1 Tax=Paraburkholderia piptadeniae TaxID=1701573 RepID=A0A1N7RWJ5_9BURK|nr:hypothetical protein BN2476_230019 [Paraburkholderia piptadeniae]